MAVTAPARRRIEAAVKESERRIAALVRNLVRRVVAIIRDAAKASKKTAPKSSPAQVRKLQERILKTLRGIDGPASAQTIAGALGLTAADAGRFTYALDRLKSDGRVRQIGSRRVARYVVAPASSPGQKD